jgi:hypothetical protein
VEEAGTRLSLQEARLLQDIADRPASSEFRVRLDLRRLDERAMQRLTELMEEAPGNCPVVFELCRPDGSVCVMRAQQRVKPSQELVEAIRQVCGDHAVASVGA